MEDRNAVLVSRYRPNEPDLTMGMLLDAVSTLSHVTAPFSWRDFVDLKEIVVRDWRSPKTVTRDITHAQVEGWAAQLQRALNGPIDRTGVDRALRKSTKIRRSGTWTGPVVNGFGRLTQLARANILIRSGGYPLSLHAATAFTEAVLVAGTALPSGKVPSAPPTRGQTDRGVQWLVAQWEALVLRGDAGDVIATPGWWYEIWSAGRGMSADWAYDHPALVVAAQHAIPGFDRWWAIAGPRVTAERKALREQALRDWTDWALRQHHRRLGPLTPANFGTVSGYQRQQRAELQRWLVPAQRHPSAGHLALGAVTLEPLALTGQFCSCRCLGVKDCRPTGLRVPTSARTTGGGMTRRAIAHPSRWPTSPTQ